MPVLTPAALVLHHFAVNGMVMAMPAHHQGLPLPRSHLSDPGWWLAFPRPPKVPQLPDVVDFNPHVRAAQLTCVGQESFHQFRAGGFLPLGRLIVESCLHIASERDGSPLRYQWFVACALDHHT